MLRPPGAARLLAAVLAVAVLAACSPGSIFVRLPKVETHRSAPQTLVLANATAGPLRLIRVEAEATPLVIAPGADVSLAFTLIAVAEIAPSDDGAWYVPIRAGQQLILRAAGGYLRMSGPDLLASVLGADGTPWDLRFALKSCAGEGWLGAPARAAPHPIELLDPPLQGVPYALVCPIP